jgi:hypothetical protein
MPGPGPIGILARPVALAGLTGLVARMSPILPGPDGSARGDRLSEASSAGPLVAEPTNGPSFDGPLTGGTEQDRSGPGEPWAGAQK